MEEQEGLNRRVFVAGGLFEEERRRSGELGRFAFIRPLERDGRDVWRAVHDLRAKPAGDRFEENTMHGLAPCGVEP